MLFEVIPREVIFNHVLKYLSVDDVIRLRNVCKEANYVCQDYLKEKCLPNMNEIEINETDFTVVDFLNQGIPYSHIYVNNSISGSHFFDNSYVEHFLRIYGSRVTHVRIARFTLRLSENEQNFYQNLKNMESLQIACIASQPQNKNFFEELYKFSSYDKVGALCDYPTTFKNLKRLLFVFKEKDFNKETFIWSLVFTQHCKNLTTFGNSVWCDAATENAMEFGEMLNKTMEVCISEQPLLKQFDFRNWQQINIDYIRENAEEVKQFLTKCVSQKIKLLHFNSVMFEVVNPFLVPDANIVSLQNLHTFVQIMNMTSLEQINVITSMSSINYKMVRPNYNSFVNLERINLVIDSIYMQPTRWFEDGVIYNTGDIQLTTHLLDFLFRSCHRLRLMNLDIYYDSHLSAKQGFNTKVLPLIKIIELSICCPNLSKLSLHQWPGTNKGLSKIWTKFRHLRDVSFDHCENLGNVAFVGLNTNAPVCFHAKNLRKLSLKGLDKMPKITNTLLFSVIQHVPLTHFLITSDSALPPMQITADGILCLSFGIFGKSIESFPFTDWNIEGFTDEEFKNLSRKFRSSFLH